MTMYGVTVTKMFETVIEVEAENHEEAVRKVLSGEGEEYERFNEEIVPDPIDTYEVVEEYTGHQENIVIDD